MIGFIRVKERDMKRLGVLLLMLMLTFSVTFALGNKNVEPPGSGDSLVSGELQVVGETRQDDAATINRQDNASTIGLQDEAAVDWLGATASAGTAETGGEPPGGKISPAIDNVVTVTIIPLLVLVIGLFWKSFDKNRFTMLLLQLWGLIKDADNFFAFPDAAQKRLIEANGINAAKKLWVAEQAVKSIRQEDVTYLKKKTGSLGNAIELAINIFKTGAGAISLGKKVISVFK